MMAARAAHDAYGTSMTFATRPARSAPARRIAGVALSLVLLASAAPALAQQNAPAPASQKDDTLTPPPVVDPKPVETTPVAPAPVKALAPEEVSLQPVPVITLSGHATWEEAYDKLVATMKTLDKELGRLGLTRKGDVLVVYSSSDDLGFDYEVQMPFSGTTTQKPSGNIKLGGSYTGKVLKFTHSGSFADMDNTYEQIANYLDEKNVNADELYVEQYRTDLTTTAPDALTIDILVPAPK